MAADRLHVVGLYEPIHKHRNNDLTAAATYAGALNLTIYSGLYGGKWCYSIYDPPPPAGDPRALSGPERGMLKKD